ncbi:class I poly(R)-hydroxyalkanoic acid synthase [Porphyrobacter sp. TH134]|uniref:PHA/PHB synthase family protein n=1 Tax=Porphyrobacter sp. TH134 TaxID=2067450 RepID=UPI000C7A9DA1|nr:class I poly(R)-hydroxyalkanoic acid synthase [Porphyrobacter sp. TH134]PLK23030.1 class I poly(R)-hydroxyalkanoic acid synthase [Porphyrobacter sp. TH134]
MAQDSDPMAATTEGLKSFFDMQGNAMREMLSGQGLDALLGAGMKGAMDPADLTQWAATATQLQQLWLDFATHQAQAAADKAAKGGAGSANMLDPAQWLVISQSMLGQMPKGMFEASAKLAQDQMQLWSGVMQSFVAGATGGKMGDAPDAAALPKNDRRFADPAWREHPAFLLLHQTYLMLADYFKSSVRQMDGLDRAKRQQLEFAVSALAEAMSPDNFLALNPAVMKRTMETKGANLVRGMQHLIGDLKRGQLTHTDPNAFRLGENLAATPGKVVHETPIFQLIQYSPTTETVLEVPLIIFPPWINRFYILDLTPKKSFIKWAVDQGITVFVVSWKSADETMGDVVWDDYVRAQMEAIDHVRARLDVPAVHTIGYCVAGTTLAATLAILSRRGEADKVKSATFFTAQVDFEKSGDLKNFIDDGQLEMIGQLSPHGYLDGRYLAAAFNALRGRDLIWNYVVNNYMMGEDYPAFDLLHWNGDVTNLPSKWHNAYLRDLYRDNKLVVPDALEADGTPIDLTRVATPSFVQAGREDHIAPAESVWRITKHFTGPMEFLLAGSGHIAGVVNPPAAGKYQYWVGDSAAPSLKDFVAGATEHPGSWWPHWLEWLHRQSDTRVPATGKRMPGGKGDPAIEDAPGRYVKTR